MKTDRHDRAHWFAVVLAGGRGTRFWPRSRRKLPKQLLSLTGTKSLLEGTLERIRTLVPPERVWVLTNEHLASAVARQLPEVPQSQIIPEPEQRNTAPAIGLAAELISLHDPDAVLGVFPSDHVIEKERPFTRIADVAFAAAERGDIVVLGIQPRWAETGYGYIEFSEVPRRGARPRAVAVRRFREKPDAAAAKRFLRTGRFFWNSGMFFWKATVIREAVRTYLADTAAVISSIVDAAGKDNAARLRRAMRKSYGECQNISIDYAVLERAANVRGIPCDIGWNDVGSWRAAYDLMLRPKDSNVLRSPALLLESSGLYVDAPQKLIAAVGVQDLVIVDTPDALLVVPRHRAHEVSKIVAELERTGREEFL